MTVGWIDVYGMEFPRRPDFNMISPVGTAVIDATGEKLAAMGRVWHRYSGAKLIDRVWWRFGTVVKAGGSALITSLQDIDLASGPPQRPDGTMDQQVAMSNASLVVGMVRSDPLSAQRSVSRGDRLGAMLEFDGAGRLGSDAFTPQFLQFTNNIHRQNDTGVSLFSSSAWATTGLLPHGLLEFSDGTFGTWNGTWPHSSSSGNFNFNVNDAGVDERGMKFDVPVPMKVMGVSFMLQMASGADFDMVLYDGSNTVLATVSADANAIDATAAQRRMDLLFSSGVLLEPGQTYRVTLKPTTTNNIATQEFIQTDANHWQAWPGPTSWQVTSRVDAGAWTDTPTRRFPISLLVSQMLVSPAQLINSEGLVG